MMYRLHRFDKTKIINIFSSLARILHTDRNEEAAKVGWGQADEHFDAGLYVSIPPKSQCESNTTSTLASRAPQVIGMKYAG